MASTHDTPPWRDWHGHALVVGPGGIGQALLDALPSRAPGLTVWSAGRRPLDRQRHLVVDVLDDGSLDRFAEAVAERLSPLRLVICTVGILHAEDLQPEKRLARVRRGSLERSFAVNAWGSLLLARAVEAALPSALPFHFASLSARVGSIGDNRSGGWYAYRAAKAAQNQLLRTLSVEWRRRLPLGCVTLLHPGTTATALSAPFLASVPAERLFSPARAAHQLLDVLEAQGPATSGAFLAWDGSTIPW